MRRVLSRCIMAFFDCFPPKTRMASHPVLQNCKFSFFVLYYYKFLENCFYKGTA